MPFAPTDRTHLRARLWHADMLIMDGQLLDGSRLLLEAYESLERVPLDWAEMVRHRGHAFRFSFVFEQAEALYHAAISAVPRARSLQGKLQTNLAETFCWCDPERAIVAANLSTELNFRLGNKIELAKAEAARAIALAKLGQIEPAVDSIAKSSGHARTAGYKAGGAFALQAEAVLAGLTGDTVGLHDAHARLRDAVQVLGTYGHLLVAPAVLMGDDEAFLEAALDVDWIEPERLEERLGVYLKPNDEPVGLAEA